MPFGKTMTKPKDEKNVTDGEQVVYKHPFMNIAQGHRKFRILPEVVDGIVNEQPLEDAFGRPTKVLVQVPETEIRWLEAWWPVNVGGSQQKRRFILDWHNPWKNPLWKFIQANYEKGSEERRALKNRFGINVIDFTPVVFDEFGNPVYADISGVYRIDQRGKVLDNPVAGDPQPHNAVRIFEGSTGDEGGKHLFQAVIDAFDGLENNEGQAINPAGASILIKTTGTGIKTVRSVKTANDFKPLDPVFIFLPRYDITSWATPWPDQAIERLLDAEDFNDIAEEYNLKLYPELIEFPEEAPKTKKKPKAKEEELFDD